MIDNGSNFYSVLSQEVWPDRTWRQAGWTYSQAAGNKVAGKADRQSGNTSGQKPSGHTVKQGTSMHDIQAA
jgi:hypothetical protein